MLLKVGNELGHSILHGKGNRFFSGTSNNQEEKRSLEQMDPRDQQIHVSLNNQSEKIRTLSSTLDVSSEAVGMDSRYFMTSKLSETFESSDNSEVIELDPKNMTGHKVVDESSPTPSTSILDKLFGSAMALNGVDAPSFIEVSVFFFVLESLDLAKLSMSISHTLAQGLEYF